MCTNSNKPTRGMEVFLYHKNILRNCQLFLSIFFKIFTGNISVRNLTSYVNAFNMVSLLNAIRLLFMTRSLLVSHGLTGASTQATCLVSPQIQHHRKNYKYNHPIVWNAIDPSGKLF